MSSTSFTPACRAKAFTRARSSGVARSAMCDVTPPFLTAMPQRSYVCDVTQTNVSEPAFTVRQAPELVAEVADLPSLSNIFNIFGNQANKAVDGAKDAFQTADKAKATPSGANKPDVIDTDIKVPRMPSFKTPSNDKQADDLLRSDVAFRMTPAPVAEVADLPSLSNFFNLFSKKAAEGVQGAQTAPLKDPAQDYQLPPGAGKATPGAPKPDVDTRSDGKPADADIPRMPDFGVPKDDKQAEELLQTEPVSFRTEAAVPVAELAQAGPPKPDVASNSEGKPVDADIPRMPDFGVPKDDKQADELLQTEPISFSNDVAPVAEVADLPPPLSFFEAMRKPGAGEGSEFQSPDASKVFKPANTDSTPALDTNTKVPGAPDFGVPANDDQAKKVLK